MGEGVTSTLNSYHTPVLQGRGSGVTPGCLNPAPLRRRWTCAAPRTSVTPQASKWALGLPSSMTTSHTCTRVSGSLPTPATRTFCLLRCSRPSIVGRTARRIVPNSPHFGIILSKKSKTLKLLLLRLGVYWGVGILSGWECNRVAFASPG